MTVLALDNVTVRATLPGGLEVDVLQDVSVKLEAGAMLGLIGESGAGKSMVGRVVMQVLPPNFRVVSGSVRFKGEDILAATPARQRRLRGRHITFIPQDPLSSLNPVISIGAQFDEYLRRLGLRGRAARNRRAEELLDAVNLADPGLVRVKYPHELSGGMCQRVLIAMAFASEPSLIIADEPTTAVDAFTQSKIATLLRRLQENSGTSVIFITHDLRLASHICDEMMVLYAGQPVEYGPAREVLARPAHPYTQSLEAANPRLTRPLNRLTPLPSNMPGLRAFAGLAGCRFAKRCPVSESGCAAELPPARAITPGHWVRCAPACSAAHRPSAQVPPTRRAAEPSSSTPLLEVANVTMRYATPRRLWRPGGSVTAVDDVSFKLHEGEFLGVLGLSGSGKSTLARMLVGLETPDSGSILLDGRDITADDAETRRRRMTSLQMIFQNPQSALNPRRPVARLVTQVMEGLAAGKSAADRAARARALLGDVGLPEDTLYRYPMQLSGGQRQRVGIARALCVAPRIIIADEIVSGLDVSVQAQILNLLLELRECTGISMIFISHDLSVVRYLCSRVLVMRDGCIIEEGSSEQVLSQPRHHYTQALLRAVPPEDPETEWVGEAALIEVA